MKIELLRWTSFETVEITFESWTFPGRKEVERIIFEALNKKTKNDAEKS